MEELIMPYQPSEKCNYMGLKLLEEWGAPDNKTCADSNDRYNKLLTVNLRPKLYQRARDNNIKRRLELVDKLQYEPPIDYIDKMVQAYVNDEIKITDIFVQSSTSPLRPESAPQRCYLIGKKNVIKAKAYEKYEDDWGKNKVLGSLLVADFSLIFGVYDVDNKYTEKFVTDVISNTVYFLNKVMEYWEFNIKRLEAETSNQQGVTTGINPNNDSEIDDETQEPDATGGEYEDDENSMEYNNNLGIILGDEPLDGFDTYDSDMQIGENFPEDSEYDSYSDLTGNLNDLM